MDPRRGRDVILTDAGGETPLELVTALVNLVERLPALGGEPHIAATAVLGVASARDQALFLHVLHLARDRRRVDAQTSSNVQDAQFVRTAVHEQTQEGQPRRRHPDLAGEHVQQHLVGAHDLPQKVRRSSRVV